MSPTVGRAAYVAAAVLAALGLTLRVVPAAVPHMPAEMPEPYRVPETPSGAEQAATLLSFNDIVAANLFAADRTPAEERYTPPELTDPAAGSGNADPGSETRPRWQFRLYGTAVGPEGSVALIDADPTIPGAEVYRVGDRVGAALLIEIRETAAVLDGTTGRFTLTLPTSIRR